MANDILNTGNATTGNQVLGRATINTGGRGTNGKQHLQSDHPVTIPVASIAAKYDARFDDPRYYAGDTAS